MNVYVNHSLRCQQLLQAVLAAAHACRACQTSGRDVSAAAPKQHSRKCRVWPHSPMKKLFRIRQYLFDANELKRARLRHAGLEGQASTAWGNIQLPGRVAAFASILFYKQFLKYINIVRKLSGCADTHTETAVNAVSPAAVTRVSGTACCSLAHRARL
jgi:hypothetical protein